MPIRSRSTVFRLALPLFLCFVAVLLVHTARRLERAAWTYPLVAHPPFHQATSQGDPIPDEVLDTVPVPMEFTLRPGETLGQVFQRLGLEPAAAHAAGQAVTEHVDPRKLRAGASYAAYFEVSSAAQTAPSGFLIPVADEGEVRVAYEQGAWRSRWQPYRRSFHPGWVAGELQGALETSIIEAGGHGQLAYSLADVLQWDLDFNRDLRLGDRFRALYEVVMLDGRFHQIGGVEAVIYDNNGQRLEAYRFGDDGGYYDADGRPLRKQFLRSPLRYSRVTSGFSQRRFHPVLKVHRPHYGVDYGAPTGTPVRVTANGVVASAGWDAGGGRTVKVRHANGYVTAYLHLSGFARGVGQGARVTQGQVIGYVGSTGLATAAHLDYRVQHQGRWINPLSLENEPAEPIPENRLADFEAHRDSLRSRLAAGDHAEVATGADDAALGQAGEVREPSAVAAQSGGR